MVRASNTRWWRRPATIWTTIVALCVAATISCAPQSKDQPFSWESVDPDFYQIGEVSASLALLGSNLELRRSAECEFVEHISDYVDAPDQETQRFHERVQRFCDVLSQAAREKRIVFEQIKDTGVVPANLFMFSTYEETFMADQFLFEEFSIGPFRDLVTCAAVEHVLRDAGDPTSICTAHTEEW